MKFKWHPDEDPPQIETHSKAKLRVLRSYLKAYFDRLNINPRREEFKIALIDGFAGGGTFLDGGEVISGSPLVMLEESQAARIRLNAGRNKPLNVNCKFYFIDKERAHTDHLQKVLRNRGFGTDDSSIIVRNAPFECELEEILRSIQEWQPRAGRAIFLLDQTGYSQVKLTQISQIFEHLQAAEVILTFAADALVNYLSNDVRTVSAIAPLQLTESDIRKLIQISGGDGGLALAQRVLYDHVCGATRAQFFTPFFVRPSMSRRALWLLHLSQHPTARDVMIQQHWENRNTFQHFGHGGFGMLGWDAMRDTESLHIFKFNEQDANQMKHQLLDSLPNEIFRLVSEQPVSIGKMRHIFANYTAARFSDFDSVILRLHSEKEFRILNPNGKPRSPQLKRVSPNDLIALPETLLIPQWSRLTT